MDCAMSLQLLSDYYAGTLDQTNSEGVKLHLTDCPGCDGVFKDLVAIVLAASQLSLIKPDTNGGLDGIAFPDEALIWQRMNLDGRIVH